MFYFGLGYRWTESRSTMLSNGQRIRKVDGRMDSSIFGVSSWNRLPSGTHIRRKQLTRNNLTRKFIIARHFTKKIFLRIKLNVIWYTEKTKKKKKCIYNHNKKYVQRYFQS